MIKSAQQKSAQYKPISIKILQVEDVSEECIKWYSNKEVTRYSDNQYRSFSVEDQKNYVRSCLDNNDVDLYGIFFKSKHIGNIVISGLTSVHKRAEIAYFIGDTNCWGKGYGSYALAEIIKKAKTHYKLFKLYAGLAEGNKGSEAVLRKNGFTLEGRRKNHLFYSGKWCDQLDFGLIIQ
ncbi:RimL Acetyltransferases, including N-acetylases of ribosomal proteins [Candidatus Methylopumilus universalis]|uniref:GNAT family N-acetyltransferase n=1 Tax=Candidatus Methylopumilus universalis TaxID=2588536 RepID=UPI003BEF14E4